MNRESLDRHITGNYGEDQLRYITLVDDEVDDSGPEDDAPRFYHSDRLGAVTIPED